MTPTLPDWMDVPPTPSREEGEAKATRGRRSSAGHLQSPFYEAMAREIIAGESASAPGFLQRMDPRAKLVGTLLLLIATSLASNLALLAAALGAALVLPITSRARAGAMLRMLVPPVLLSVVVILPAALNVITPGKPLVQVAHLGQQRDLLGITIPAVISITQEGVTAVLRFVLRSTACVAWALGLALTTRWTAILSALGAIGLPRVFTLIVTMMYRYVFALLRHAEETRLARTSRTLTRERTLQGERRAAGGMARMFQTSRRLAEQVYLAMASRGFTGEARGLDRFKMTASDYAAAGLAAAVSAALIVTDRML